jgi:hypothetical protein
VRERLTARLRPACCIAAAIALSVVATGTASPMPQSGPHASTHTFVSTGSGLKFVDKTLCTVVSSGTAAAAGKSLLQRLSGGRIKASSVLATVVFSSISYFCPKVMPKATRAVARFFGLQRQPSASPTKQQFQSAYVDVRPGIVASEFLGINPAWGIYRASDVVFLVNRVCFEVATGRNPISQTIAPYFPGARLDRATIAAMNGFVSLVLDCRRPKLKPWQMNYLVSAITSYLTANTYRLDLEPPIAYVSVPFETPYTNGTARLDVSWSGYDRLSGVSTYDVWLYRNDHWEHVPRAALTGAASAAVLVRRGDTFRFAVQAIDRAGNRSAWAFGLWYYAR